MEQSFSASLGFVRASMPRSPIVRCGMTATPSTSAAILTVHGAVDVYIEDLERRSSAHSPADVEQIRTRVLGCRHGSVGRVRLARFVDDDESLVSGDCEMAVHRQEILGTRSGTPKRVTTTRRPEIEGDDESGPLRKTMSL
ncbi:hypothetical protein CLOM_g6628 [Closterium sp. NIES-68]|nr:hypothetical protein CLOM_g6628 [Closterium sp. NIES-68]GJP70852.1 hypothetical protein CLOP_g1745 [Closterium sp. NIES-67]